MNNLTIFEKVKDWIRNSITLKLIAITILMLLLLIPVSMIQSIINERANLHEQATREVSSKWADEQQINGPILTIPIIYLNKTDKETVETTRYLHLLPDRLNIKGQIDPETLHRGIYEVVVYRSAIEITGNFVLKFRIDQNNLKAIRYDQAFLTIGISDLRGIKNDPAVHWGDQVFRVSPGSRNPDLVRSGITIGIPDLENNMGNKVSFGFKLSLQGSHNLSFIPVGRTNEISITSAWATPSFSGNFLPDSRSITHQGFKANWKILQLNRNYPQAWTGHSVSSQDMASSAFGVDLLLSIDNYKKSHRSAKYAVMTIALTFLIFFLVEIRTKKKIHPFQYALIGLALSLFYILLVSITEHSSFSLAYIISTVGISGMIFFYSLAVFNKKKHSILLLLTLIGLYSFLFVVLQLEDYALLMGSLGLMVILAATMYFTRNVNWYNMSNDTN